jgi:hypothetical protein
MSVECDRAAVRRVESRWSGWRPYAARVAFTAARRFNSELDLLFAASAAGAASRSKLTAKNAQI